MITEELKRRYLEIAIPLLLNREDKCMDCGSYCDNEESIFRTNYNIECTLDVCCYLCFELPLCLEDKRRASRLGACI